ncbi:hypothetical protein IMZ38_01085 [Thermosphaera chiliense]|uniref:Uncharacterized protein n=1 Tax=Thermosphaera chiliense TaxID=3402707 RepID=A0A7M1UUB8_9CREN|nr:hypothetical protein [Thermosphaera aggregans]QOR94564.1 hypothetical protein IMZ38_01085 [Thermosphaera aggregans]
MKSVSTIVGGYLVLVITVMMVSQLAYSYTQSIESWRSVQKSTVESLTSITNPPLLSLRVLNGELYLIVKTVQPVLIEAVFKEYEGYRSLAKVSETVSGELLFPLNYTGIPFKTGVVLSGGVLLYYSPWRDPWLQTAPPEIVGRTVIDEELVSYLNSASRTQLVLNLDWAGYKVGLGIVNYTNTGPDFKTLIEKGPVQCYQTIPTPYLCTVSMVQNYGWLTYGELPSKPYYSFITYNGVLTDPARGLIYENGILKLNLSSLSPYLGLQGGHTYVQVFRAALVYDDLEASFTVNASIINATKSSRIFVTAYVYDPRVNIMQPVLIDSSSIGSTGPHPWIGRMVVEAPPQGVLQVQGVFNLTVSLSGLGLKEALVVYGVELVSTVVASTMVQVELTGLRVQG